MSFAHPEGFEAETKDNANGIKEVTLRDPGAGDDADYIHLTIAPGRGGDIEPLSRSVRVAAESIFKAEPGDEREVDVEGATAARRIDITQPGRDGAPQVDRRDLLVLAPGRALLHPRRRRGRRRRRHRPRRRDRVVQARGRVVTRTRVPADVPRWPVWMAPVALVATWVAGWIVMLLVAVTLAVRGEDAFDGASVLLLVGLTAAAGAGDRGLARRARRGAAARGVRPAHGAAAAGRRGRAAGAGRGRRRGARRAGRRRRVRRAAGAAGGVRAGRARPGSSAIPTRRSSTSTRGAICSLLARAVIVPLFGELLLRGFCLPILGRRFGDGWAVGGLAALTALLGAGAAGEPWLLAAVARARRGARPALPRDGGSIVPGAAVSAVWAGAVLAAGFRWDVADGGRPRALLRRAGGRRGARAGTAGRRRPARRLSLVAD